MRFLDPVMMCGPGRHLRRMGHNQQLGFLRQPRQPFADRAGHRATDATVNFIEDHRCRIPGLGQRDLERQNEARQLTARSDASEWSEWCAGVGRYFKLDPVDPGQSYSYDLVVANTGPADATNVAVSDSVPAALSDRELVVLRYLPSRLANAEIAANMYVSLNTVKSHLGSIYRKLGVTGRRDAIAQAEKLKLI